MNGASRVGQIAAYRKWGGGVRIEHLARLMGMRPSDPRLLPYIWQARQLGLVDIWQGWVIADRNVIEKRRRS
jgi:hypothetical protein